MKNTSVSLFRQVLDLIPKREFEEIVMKHNGDKRKQSFDSWAHFVSMIFCQLAQANSLREICGGLKICGGKLNHLGVESAPTKSNLSYANAHRSPKMFGDIFHMLPGHCHAIAPRHEFSFPKKLYSLDATQLSNELDTMADHSHNNISASSLQDTSGQSYRQILPAMVNRNYIPK